MNKKKAAILTIAFALALSAVALVASCSPASTSSAMGPSAASASSASTGYTTVSVDDARQMIYAGGVTIVDVRTQSEYESGHLPGAVLVTLGTISDAQLEALPDKDASLLVYCRTGVRSAQASAVLVELGYTKVFNMGGGITAWKYDTVTEA